MRLWLLADSKRHNGKAQANNNLYPPGLLCIALEKDDRLTHADDSTPGYKHH